MSDRIDPPNDSGRTHYYGDGCDDAHGVFSETEIDALQNAVAHWLADYLVKGWDKPDEFATMIAVGQKIGMKL